MAQQVKNLPAKAGKTKKSGKIPGGGNDNSLQYSCLENSMNGGAWWATVHWVVKSWTLLRDLTFTFHFDALEKKMAIHSSILAWRIPGMAASVIITMLLKF